MVVGGGLGTAIVIVVGSGGLVGVRGESPLVKSDSSGNGES